MQKLWQQLEAGAAQLKNVRALGASQQDASSSAPAPPPPQPAAPTSAPSQPQAAPGGKQYLRCELHAPLGTTCENFSSKRISSLPNRFDFGRLPVESARKLRWYEHAELPALVRGHLREKRELQDCIAAMKKVCVFSTGSSQGYL
jgi:hypothetical protein